jgi:hypothetical protein
MAMPVLAPTEAAPAANPIRVVPDVWNEPATGLEWCDCGKHHPLTRSHILGVAWDLFGDDLPERITHREVIRITMDVWNYASVCRFFTMAMEDSARRVHGEVAADYPLETGLAIVKDFSNHWNGCPTKDCDGGFTPEDV